MVLLTPLATKSQHKQKSWHHENRENRGIVDEPANAAERYV
jgi:hypothetical protein